jgi:hypothetical protein
MLPLSLLEGNRSPFGPGFNLAKLTLEKFILDKIDALRASKIFRLDYFVDLILSAVRPDFDSLQ